MTRSLRICDYNKLFYQWLLFPDLLASSYLHNYKTHILKTCILALVCKQTNKKLGEFSQLYALIYCFKVCLHLGKCFRNREPGEELILGSKFHQSSETNPNNGVTVVLVNSSSEPPLQSMAYLLKASSLSSLLNYFLSPYSHGC